MIEKLNIPENIQEILKEDGIWEDSSFDPIQITITESEFKGVEVIGFQMEFPSWEKIGKIGEFLEKEEIDLDGDQWEAILRSYLQIKNPDLEKIIHGDSESETCVLWVETKDDFVEMMKWVLDFFEGSEDVKELIRKNADDDF